MLIKPKPYKVADTIQFDDQFGVLDGPIARQLEENLSANPPFFYLLRAHSWGSAADPLDYEIDLDMSDEGPSFRGSLADVFGDMVENMHSETDRARVVEVVTAIKKLCDDTLAKAGAVTGLDAD